MSDKVISSTTQEFLDVYDIVNDMVLLKDGTASVILQIGTMNFSLLAEQEQDAVIFTYGSLLNSLNYPIQINIQSQTKDATKYLRLLEEQVQKASSDRKATLIKQYRDFVATLIKERNVLQKRFYIIVPASPGEMGLITPSGVLPGKTAFDITSVEKSILLEKATNILEPRRDHLTAQFNRLGLFTRQLTTQEIIQNFYINYNPEAAEGQEISSSENYTTPLVRASFGGKFMQLNNQTSNQQSPLIQDQITATPAASPISNNEDTLIAASENITTATQDINQPELSSPITTNPSAEEILSNEPTQTVIYPEPNLNNTTDNPQIENLAKAATANEITSEIDMPPIIETTPINTVPEPVNAIPEPISSPISVPPELPNQENPVVNSQSPELDLNLDPNLLSANSVNTTNNNLTIDNSTDSNLVEGFGEDITPLQNKFEEQAQEPILNQELPSDQTIKTQA